MNVEILRVHIGDYIARRASSSLLGLHHGKRIKQKTLDFYRMNWTKFNAGKRSGGEVLFLVAIADGSHVIGVSACAIPRKSDSCWYSATVVHSEYRNRGIGKLLLQAKLDCLSGIYNSHRLFAFVNKTNENAMRLCKSAKMFLVEKNVSQLEDGSTKVSYTYSNKDN